MEYFLRKNWWLRTNCGVSARSELVRKLSGRNFVIQHIFQQFCLQIEWKYVKMKDFGKTDRPSFFPTSQNLV